MSLPAPLPRLRDPQADTMSTTCFISNLHCPSCIDVIQASLSALDPPPQDVFVSIVSHSVVLRHAVSLSLDEITGSLEAAGFEVHSVFQNDKAVRHPVEVRSPNSEGKSKEWHTSLERAVSHWLHPQRPDGSSDEMKKKEAHLAQCEQCKKEQGGVSLDSADTLPAKSHPFVTSLSRTSTDDSVPPRPKLPFAEKFVAVETPDTIKTYKATLSVNGMTCSSCVSAITHAVQEHPWVQSVNVNLLTNSGVFTFSGKEKCDELVETIEDCGFEVAVEKLEEVRNTKLEASLPKQKTERWHATYSIGGLTCSSCVANVTGALKIHAWIETIDVNLISNSATIVFIGKEHLSEIKESIEDAGYTATLEKIIPEGTVVTEALERAVAIRIDGMFCPHCPQNIVRGLQDAFADRDTFLLEDPPLSLTQPILRIKYVPDLPNFTLRHVFSAISNINPVFKPSAFHPPTLEERAQQMHAQERTRILFRLLLCVVVAIPTFILGIVFMSLVSSHNPVRKYLMGNMWAGNVTRLSWALFILATPVYFFAADTFHRRAIKEIKFMWRPGSRTPYLHRFIRFGSMNMLISLGTTIAYLASIAELILAATKTSTGSMTDSYFDAVVFLTMFLLIGRFLEAYSKAKTGDAVTSLGKLRPNEAVLVDPEQGDVKIATDLLEIGDVVRVHHGTSPPFDGDVIEGSSNFDESSLTGESRPVKKSEGDTVYSGTMNKGAPVKIRITNISGSSMLDQIINAVREGQSHRAPVERAADVITSHFAPFVIAVAIITWMTWLILGTTAGIPSDWKSDAAGSWALWSLRFAIAVFVIACPCGIGLAAPTALFVGGGLAAKHGILVRGGGEAFQEASSLDCIVFDKTGTLTQGGDPAVTNHKFCGDQDHSLVVGVVKALEENSSHPIARAIVSFCNKEEHVTPTVIDVDEVPGKGLKGTFRLDGQEITAIVGNESFMADYHVPIRTEDAGLLQNWKSQGESVTLIALLMPRPSQESTQPSQSSDVTETLSTAVTEARPSSTWHLACSFSIADALRPEAPGVIKALHARGIDVWMLSGDNPTTANAVGAQVGIPSSNIIAGVLPDQKAEKIKYLQQTLSKPQKTFSRIPFLGGRNKGTAKRATVAMVGDGINDAPALSTADLSIAIGSGSDIALSSSSFILINSRLSSILTLLDLSRVVFRRVYFNFGWALVYNMIAMPVAAGVLFPITTGGGNKPMDMHHEGVGMEGGMAMEQTGKSHVRLDPVWASLAMALSSISVVCSSLSLRSNLPGVGFRIKREESE